MRPCDSHRQLHTHPFLGDAVLLSASEACRRFAVSGLLAARSRRLLARAAFSLLGILAHLLRPTLRLPVALWEEGLCKQENQKIFGASRKSAESKENY